MSFSRYLRESAIVRMISGGRFVIRGVVLIFSLLTLSLVLVHTGPGRRWTLTRIEALAKSSAGVIVTADDLNYNLLSSRFTLTGVSVRSTGRSNLTRPSRQGRS